MNALTADGRIPRAQANRDISSWHSGAMLPPLNTLEEIIEPSPIPTIADLKAHNDAQRLELSDNMCAAIIRTAHVMDAAARLELFESISTMQRQLDELHEEWRALLELEQVEGRQWDNPDTYDLAEAAEFWEAA